MSNHLTVTPAPGNYLISDVKQEPIIPRFTVSSLLIVSSQSQRTAACRLSLLHCACAFQSFSRALCGVRLFAAGSPCCLQWLAWRLR